MRVSSTDCVGKRAESVSPEPVANVAVDARHKTWAFVDESGVNLDEAGTGREARKLQSLMQSQKRMFSHLEVARGPMPALFMSGSTHRCGQPETDVNCSGDVLLVSQKDPIPLHPGGG
jgi:hypothetical protein